MNLNIRGKTIKRNQVWASSFKATDFPLQGDKNVADPFSGSGDTIDLSDDDLPF